MKRDEPEWLNPLKAARRLGITRKELLRLIDEGALVGYRFGTIVRVRVDDLEDYLRRHPPADS